MISLHLVLLFRRLRSESRDAREFSQAVFDVFFKDMDRSLREMGAADLGVPKRIQKMGSLFYGLLGKLSAPLTSGDVSELEAVLTRNVFGGVQTVGAGLLARYLLEEAAALAAQPTESILAGNLALGVVA